MKIAIFTDTYHPEINGVTKTLDKMKESMDKKGIEYIFFAPGEAPFEGEVANVSFFTSFRFFAYPQCRIALPDYGAVKKRLDDFKPDIIHLTTPFIIGLSGLRYAKENGIPHTATFHTDFPEYLDHYGFGVLKSGAWQFLRWFHDSTDINFAPSSQTMEKMRSKGIERLGLWKRGIEKHRFNPGFRDESLRESWVEEGAVCLLHVGRLAKEKELDVLMGAVGILNEKGVRFKLVIVGDGPMRSQMEDLGHKNVVFCGYMTGDSLSRCYASSDVFCFTSGTETYGNVLIEAMASGLPAVSVTDGGAGENVIDGINSLAFERGSSRDMAEKLEKIIMDETLRKRLSNGAINHVSGKDWGKVFDGLFSKYKDLANQKREKSERSAS